MQGKRPVALDLFSVRLPLTAVVSILHRLTGMLLFFLMPVLLWSLKYSLDNPNSFASLAQFFDAPWVKILAIVALWGLWHHLLAGIRHLLMDFGMGEGLANARKSAWATVGLALILALGMGVCLW